MGIGTRGIDRGFDDMVDGGGGADVVDMVIIFSCFLIGSWEYLSKWGASRHESRHRDNIDVTGKWCVTVNAEAAGKRESPIRDGVFHDYFQKLKKIFHAQCPPNQNAQQIHT